METQKVHTLNRSRTGAILTGTQEALTGTIEECIRDYREHHSWGGKVDVDGLTYQGEECAYCGQEQSGARTVPPVGDDEEWLRLEMAHGENCEWLRTRAHRI